MKQHVLLTILLGLLVVACGKGDDDPHVDDQGVDETLACTTTADDSTTSTRIRSETVGSPVYRQLSGVRQTSVGGMVTIDYMVHEPGGQPQAILFLISGGNLNSNISGNEGGPPTSASGNFLVRSAHLFAARGFYVITMDRPNDAMVGPGYVMDAYRTSPRHAVDISRIINSEIANSRVSNDLPMFIAGTSRGSISAVAQYALAEGILISGPLTEDTRAGAFPLDNSSSNAASRPSRVTSPVSVLYHVSDACSYTPTSKAKVLHTQLTSAPAVATKGLSGGYNQIGYTSDCDANAFHGFYGIETCAVDQETNWLNGVLPTVASNRPTAGTTGYASGTTSIDLSTLVSDVAGGALSYSLPFGETTLGGSVSVDAAGVVTYTPSGTATSGALDYFVYTVREASGGLAHNVVYMTQ